ncbi:MAG: CPBP family intramembrane glutamic endopeptidase [bacterium]
MIKENEYPHENFKKDKGREVILFLTVAIIALAFPTAFLCSEFCSFSTVALITILRNLGLSILVFWLLKAGKEPFSRIGWTSDNLKKQILWGIILFPLFYFSVGLVLDLFTQIGFSHIEEVPPSLMPQSMQQIFLGALMVLTVAVAEEVIFRGYLLTRIIEITESDAAGVFLSTLLFAFGHGYEGVAGMVTVGYIGLVFSMLTLWQKSLSMVIVLHFFTDFIPIVVVPIMGKL